MIIIMQRIIQISDELFWGYNKIVEVDKYKSFEELGLVIKKDLILMLKMNNLEILKEKAEKLNLHNHNYDSYEEMIKINDDSIIYLCGHC